MQFADSAGNIAAEALIQANTLNYFIFPDYVLSLMLHYLKGLLAPFCLSSKRYQIPFCNLPKGISYRMQNPKIRENKRAFACGSQIPSCSLPKGR
jgi:hypothetical protein